MNEKDRIYMAVEIGKLRGVLGTLITWIAQSSVGVISPKDAEVLLKTLHEEHNEPIRP